MSQLTMSQLTKSAEVAQTILAQLGNNRFIAMTGAKDMSHGVDADGQSYLSMRIGKNSTNVTNIRVTLCHDDTYTMTFMHVRGVKVATAAEVDMVYADQMRDVFESRTGLATSL